MHLMKACLLECLVMILRVGSTEPELPTLGHDQWAAAEWIDEWYSKEATAACMRENPSLPADSSSSTVQATQKDQQASWGDDDPYRIGHINPGAVISPISTHSPPPHPHDFQAPPGPEALKAHSQTNPGLPTNTHALVRDEPVLWDLRAITHQRLKGSNSQDPFEHRFSLWPGAQQPSVGPQFTPESSHTSPASDLPANILPFSDNPHSSSSKTASQPWHQDTTFTLDMGNPYNLPAESSTAQEEHQNFRANSHHYPTSHSAAKPMISHPPLPHLPVQPGPEIQTAHPQYTGLATRSSNPTGLFGHEHIPWDIQTITNQWTNGPNSQDSFEHLTSLLPSSVPQFMPHSSYTNLASGFSHSLHVPENSQQSYFKTTTPQSKQRTSQIIQKLKPSTTTFKKHPPHTNILNLFSTGFSQTTHLIPLHSNTEPYYHLATSLPLPTEIHELTIHQGALEFHITMFEDDSTQDPVQHAERGIFHHKIDQLPGKLLIIQEDKFLATYTKYLSQKDHIQSNLTGGQLADLLQKTVIGKLLEFEEDMELWYCRWHMITSIDFEKEIPLPRIASDKMEEVVKVAFSLYLFYVEMICSIVPRESTASRDLKTELESAREWFKHLSTHPSKLLKSRLVKSPNEIWDRYILRILWTYLGHWMRNERPMVFKMKGKSDDVLPGIKSFFNRAFAFSYSAAARKYIFK